MENDANIENRRQPGRDSDIDAAGIASYVAALAFSRIALPPQLSDAVKRSIEALAEREREVSGPANADMEVRDAREKREKESDDHKENQVGWIRYEQQRQQEQEREQWAQASHSFGTVTMTGAEWRTMSEDLRDGGELRAWLLAQIMADGHTRGEAERLADKASDVAAIIATPERQRTPEQRRDLGEANRDPELSGYVEMAARHSRDLHAPESDRDLTTASADSFQSVASRSDKPQNFAAAPNLGAEFRTAQTAATPVDASRPGPLQSTAPAQRVLASGLDI